MGNLLDDGLDVRQETHVKHPVRFIEYQHFQLVEIELLAPDQVEQPPRGGDDDMDTFAQGFDLSLFVDAAMDGGHPDREGAGRRPGCFP